MPQLGCQFGLPHPYMAFHDRACAAWAGYARQITQGLDPDGSIFAATLTWCENMSIPCLLCPLRSLSHLAW